MTHSFPPRRSSDPMKGEGHMLRLREHVVKTHAIMKNDDGQSSQATKRIQFLQSRLRPWFRCHEDELSQTGYDSRNAAAGKRPPIFLLDRQHSTDRKSTRLNSSH